jgi:hypothetical protein
MLIARRMICQGDVSRCITSASEIGNTSGRCSEGTWPSWLLTEATCDSAKVRMIFGRRKCSASSASRLAKMMPIAGMSSTAVGEPTRPIPRTRSSPRDDGDIAAAIAWDAAI